MSVGALLLVAGVAMAVLSKHGSIKGEPETIEKGKMTGAKVMILFAFLALLFSQCFVIVGTGYTGVRITFGQVDKVSVSQGFNFKIPFVQTIVKVNSRQQDIEMVSESNSIESTIAGKIPINISGVTVTYQINPEQAAYIYSNVTNPDNLVTYSIVSSAIKATTPDFDTDAVVVRSEVEAAIKQMLQQYVDDKYGMDILSVLQVTVGNISFTDEYNHSVNEKNMARQAAETQEIENKKNIDKANAEAEAKLIAAKAEKEANELLVQSITNEILMQQYLEKWDGKLPAVTGTNDGVMLDVSQMLNEIKE